MTVIAGGERLERALREMAAKVKKPGVLEVGFLEDARYPNGINVAMIAAIQEYGAPAKGIPSRPFFRGMIAAKSPAWGNTLGNLLKSAEYDAPKALNVMGDGIKGQLVRSIEDMSSPPNSPVTNLLKQRFPMGGQTFADVLKARADVAGGVTAPPGKPLVQSGTMYNNVGSRVVE